jgi:hypothetical protein
MTPFPINPSNNTIFINDNNIIYLYDSSNKSWSQLIRTNDERISHGVPDDAFINLKMLDLSNEWSSYGTPSGVLYEFFDEFYKSRIYNLSLLDYSEFSSASTSINTTLTE